MNDQNPTTDTPDEVMDQKWACTKCSTTFRWGKLRLRPIDADHPFGWGCPNCGNGEGIHPADGEAVTLTEYHGEIGTLS